MKVLLFGASGTTTRAFTHACNTAPPAEEVRVVVRRSLGRMEAKLREFVHKRIMWKGHFLLVFAPKRAVLCASPCRL